MIVTSRPQSLTAVIASAAPPGAALHGQVGAVARRQPSHLARPVRRPAVENVRRPGGGDPGRGVLACGCYHLGPQARGQLHEQHSGDAAGPVDQQGRARPGAQRLVRAQRHWSATRPGTGKAAATSNGTVSGMTATSAAAAN